LSHSLDPPVHGLLRTWWHVHWRPRPAIPINPSPLLSTPARNPSLNGLVLDGFTLGTSRSDLFFMLGGCITKRKCGHENRSTPLHGAWPWNGWDMANGPEAREFTVQKIDHHVPL
jgi:hypothetical protein